MISQGKILQGVSIGHHQCEKCRWCLANVRSTSWPNAPRLSRCLLKPRTLGALLSNEYFCWRNDCGVPQLCMSSFCQSCLWPWVKPWFAFCAGDFSMFTTWWFAVWTSHEKNKCFSQKRMHLSTNPCHLCLDSSVKNLCSVVYIISPALVTSAAWRNDSLGTF